MTLIELLLVVSIIILLMAVSIPLIRPTIKDGHVREASRQLNVFIAAAKSRASLLGREAGIWLQRADPGSDLCREVYMVESPLPYMGDVADDSLGLLQDSNNDGESDRFLLNGVNSAFLMVLANLNGGDYIQFDFKGPLFRINSITQPGGAGTDILVRFAPDVGTQHRAPPPDGVVAYQVFRQPVRSSTKPLQLAGGSCIDLFYSGMSLGGQEFAAKNFQPASGPYVLDDKPIILMFHPSGSISRVYYGVNNGATVSLQDFTPTGTAYLLIGKTEQAQPIPPSTALPEVPNMLDTSATWVAIADRSGAITVAENDATLAATGGVLAARSLAATGHSMGGR